MSAITAWLGAPVTISIKDARINPSGSAFTVNVERTTGGGDPRKTALQREAASEKPPSACPACVKDGHWLSKCPKRLSERKASEKATKAKKAAAEAAEAASEPPEGGAQHGKA